MLKPQSMECGTHSQATVKNRTIWEGPLGFVVWFPLLLSTYVYNDMMMSSNVDVGFLLLGVRDKSSILFQTHRANYSHDMAWLIAESGPSIQYVATSKTSKPDQDGGDIGRV